MERRIESKLQEMIDVAAEFLVEHVMPKYADEDPADLAIDPAYRVVVAMLSKAIPGVAGEMALCDAIDEVEWRACTIDVTEFEEAE